MIKIGLSPLIKLVIMDDLRLVYPVQEHREALKVQASYVPALKGMASLLATVPDARLRNGKVAVQLALQANQRTDNRDPRGLAILAAAYAEVGQFEDALKTIDLALKIARELNAQSLIQPFQARRDTYETRRPSRLPAPAPPAK